MSIAEYIKVVIVGDGAVGKTALIIAYVNGSFPQDYLPTVADKFQKNTSVDGKIYSLSLWDTAGQEGYARLRSLSYPDTDVFLLCFSTVSPPSFQNIRDKWLGEIRHYCADAPCIIVGTKTDLRKDLQYLHDNKIDPVTSDMGTAMAQHMKLSKYLECSAKLNEGLDEIFVEVVHSYLQHKQPKQKHHEKKSLCVIL